MKVLALDTAMGASSVCVSDTDSGICVHEIRPMLRGQAEALVPMFDDVIEKAGIPYADLDLIVTTVGPGAFTGLRIGLSAARALGTALGKNVAGVTTLGVLAAQYFQDNKLKKKQQLLVVLETKRKDFYLQLFGAAQEEITKPMALSAEDILPFINKDTVLIGDACERFMSSILQEKQNIMVDDRYILPDPRVMVLMVAGQGEILPPDPLYLREADVSQSKKKNRVLE